MHTKKMLKNNRWFKGALISTVCIMLLAGGCAKQSDAESNAENTEAQQVEQAQEQENTAEIDLQESGADQLVQENSETAESTEGSAEENVSIQNESVAAPEEETQPVEAIDLQVVKPNELGEVMIAMYHGLGKKNSTYTRTPDSFREDLEKYYEMGFRPVNLSDYVQGEIDTPAGYTPMVLTFDDGNQSNFNYIEQDGEWVLDPDCSVGIIVEFNKNHPDWPLKGSFFLNGGSPFGQKEFVDEKVNWLVDNGFEVGNHSYGHDDLTELNEAEIQKSLGKNIQEIEARIPDYTVNTLALPFGKRPKDQPRYDFVTRGEYEGIPYEHIAILLVGWKPEVSVFDKGFNPLAIMRVQSGDEKLQMTDWLADYEKHPSKRYISDGDPNTVTIFEEDADRLNQDVVGDRKVVTYTLDGE